MVDLFFMMMARSFAFPFLPTGGNRAGEWELKLKGATYEEVAKAGGGIVNTVDGTRSASARALVAGAAPRVRALLREGVTTLEIKSGYGLEEGAERNQLLAARAVGEQFGVSVVSTFLGAHAVPREPVPMKDSAAKTSCFMIRWPGFSLHAARSVASVTHRFKGRSGAYVDEVVKMLPKLHAEGLVDCVDAFCESVGFSVAETERVFAKAAELGLPVTLHGDQLHDFGGGALAAKFRAWNCSHCEYTGAAGVAAMAAAGTAAVLLPTANYFIKEQRKPPVAAFRDAGVPMALATNCNPGSSPCTSVLLAMNMGPSAKILRRHTW